MANPKPEGHRAYTGPSAAGPRGLCTGLQPRQLENAPLEPSRFIPPSCLECLGAVPSKPRFTLLIAGEKKDPAERSIGKATSLIYSRSVLYSLLSTLGFFRGSKHIHVL